MLEDAEAKAHDDAEHPAEGSLGTGDDLSRQDQALVYMHCMLSSVTRCLAHDVVCMITLFNYTKKHLQQINANPLAKYFPHIFLIN
jgi:hypothetical protein